MAEVSRRRRRASDEELGDNGDLPTIGDDAKKAIEEEHDGGSSQYETESEGEEFEERQSGDGEEQPEKGSDENLDDDEDSKNPAYIPRRGAFYEHDSRSLPEADEQQPKEEERPRKKLWEEKERWLNDKFSEADQAPKSREELIALYGYDIREKDSPPDEAPRAYSTPGRGRGGGSGPRKQHNFGDFYNSNRTTRGRGGSRGRGSRGSRGSRGGKSYDDRRNQNREYSNRSNGSNDDTPKQNYRSQQNGEPSSPPKNTATKQPATCGDVRLMPENQVQTTPPRGNNRTPNRPERNQKQASPARASNNNPNRPVNAQDEVKSKRYSSQRQRSDQHQQSTAPPPAAEQMYSGQQPITTYMPTPAVPPGVPMPAAGYVAPVHQSSYPPQAPVHMGPGGAVLPDGPIYYPQTVNPPVIPEGTTYYPSAQVEPTPQGVVYYSPEDQSQIQASKSTNKRAKNVIAIVDPEQSTEENDHKVEESSITDQNVAPSNGEHASIEKNDTPEASDNKVPEGKDESISNSSNSDIVEKKAEPSSPTEIVETDVTTSKESVSPVTADIREQITLEKESSAALPKSEEDAESKSESKGDNSGDEPIPSAVETQI